MANASKPARHDTVSQRDAASSEHCTLATVDQVIFGGFILSGAPAALLSMNWLTVLLFMMAYLFLPFCTGKLHNFLGYLHLVEMAFIMYYYAFINTFLCIWIFLSSN